MSAGLTVKLIAREGSKVQFANGGESKDSWHTRSDAAGILTTPNGGYVYMSNSEESDGDGGVYGLYFNAKGEIVDYRALLTGTTDNCGGGITPWNTWVSVSPHLCVYSLQMNSRLHPHYHTNRSLTYILLLYPSYSVKRQEVDNVIK